MRYTHPFKVIRHRKHQVKISLIITAVLIILEIFLGFTQVDAKLFFVGFFDSLMRVIASYLVALVIAVCLTFFVLWSKMIEDIFLPILDVLQSFPAFALYPLMVIWFGKTSVVPIIILVFEMIWPILFTLLSAQKQVSQDLMQAATIFGAQGIKKLMYVYFPLFLPAVITGSIVAWGEAWEAIIAAEIIVGVPGVGTYLAQSGEDFHSQVLLVGVVLLLILLYIINKYIWLSLLNYTTRYQQD